jgi:hypothetical protein
VILVGAIDRRLIEELATYLHRVVVIDPAMEYVHPPDVVVVPRSLTDWPGPAEPAPLVVWNARLAPAKESVDAVRAWIAPGGWLVLATPTRCAPDVLGGLRTMVERSFVDDGHQLRVDDNAYPALVVHTMRAE